MCFAPEQKRIQWADNLFLRVTTRIYGLIVASQPWFCVFFVLCLKNLWLWQCEIKLLVGIWNIQMAPLPSPKNSSSPFSFSFLIPFKDTSGTNPSSSEFGNGAPWKPNHLPEVHVIEQYVGCHTHASQIVPDSGYCTQKVQGCERWLKKKPHFLIIFT